MSAPRDAIMAVALPLAGLMGLWLGFLRHAELSGIVKGVTLGLYPLPKRIFPDVPETARVHTHPPRPEPRRVFLR